MLAGLLENLAPVFKLDIIITLMLASLLVNMVLLH